MNTKENKNDHKADNEHIQHAEFIKKCHLNLRLNSIEVGADKAWENHCSDESLLKVKIIVKIIVYYRNVWL